MRRRSGRQGVVKGRKDKLGVICLRTGNIPTVHNHTFSSVSHIGVVLCGNFSSPVGMFIPASFTVTAEEGIGVAISGTGGPKSG